MSTRLTLLFLCDQSSLYSGFISAFASAGFQVLLANSLSHASKILTSQQVDAVIIRHDGQRDDRPVAARLKGMMPRLPVVLVTDEAQARPATIDSIWRAEIGDEVVTRAMAMFFRQYFRPTRTSGPDKLVSDLDLRSSRIRPQPAS